MVSQNQIGAHQCSLWLDGWTEVCCSQSVLCKPVWVKTNNDAHLLLLFCSLANLMFTEKWGSIDGPTMQHSHELSRTQRAKCEKMHLLSWICMIWNALEAIWFFVHNCCVWNWDGTRQIPEHKKTWARGSLLWCAWADDWANIEVWDATPNHSNDEKVCMF